MPAKDFYQRLPVAQNTPGKQPDMLCPDRYMPPQAMQIKPDKDPLAFVGRILVSFQSNLLEMSIAASDEHTLCSRIADM